MSDLLDKVIFKVLLILGEGCVWRYDFDVFSDEDGIEFVEVVELWWQLQEQVLKFEQD